MQALRFHAPGGIEKLEYGEEEKPSAPKEGEVLIKVYAVGLIHPELTWPLYQKSDGTYRSRIPGHDFSGTIVGIGPAADAQLNDSDLKPGADVYAFTSWTGHEGAMAEFAKANVDDVVPKPHGLSFVEAASVPLSALTAWQALFDHGSLQKGQRLLVLNAAGATGIWAVQFAKLAGAYVIGTGSSPESRQLFEQLGGDIFINYKTTELDDSIDADLVLDCIGGKALDQSVKALKCDGEIVSIVDYQWAERAKGLGVRGQFFIVSMDKKQLLHITDLLESKEARTVVDKVYPLSSAKQAFKDAADGHVHGKVVLRVVDE